MWKCLPTAEERVLDGGGGGAQGRGVHDGDSEIRGGNNPSQPNRSRRRRHGSRRCRPSCRRCGLPRPSCRRSGCPRPIWCTSHGGAHPGDANGVAHQRRKRERLRKNRRLLPPYHYKRFILPPCHQNFKKFVHAIEESSLYLSVIAVKLTPNTS